MCHWTARLLFELRPSRLHLVLQLNSPLLNSTSHNPPIPPSRLHLVLQLNSLLLNSTSHNPPIPLQLSEIIGSIPQRNRLLSLCIPYHMQQLLLAGPLGDLPSKYPKNCTLARHLPPHVLPQSQSRVLRPRLKPWFTSMHPIPPNSRNVSFKFGHLNEVSRRIANFSAESEGM